jgi:hypothetical protein
LVNEGLGYREVGAGEINGWGREGLVKPRDEVVIREESMWWLSCGWEGEQLLN